MPCWFLRWRFRIGARILLKLVCIKLDSSTLLVQFPSTLAAPTSSSGLRLWPNSAIRLDSGTFRAEPAAISSAERWLPVAERAALASRGAPDESMGRYAAI